MCDDKYTYSQIMTIGGLGGTTGTTYVLEAPFTGDEYEYQILSVATGDVAGQYLAIMSADQSITALPFDGSATIGVTSTAPFNFLKCHPVRLGPTTTLLAAGAWVRVANGAKYLYVRAFTPSASSIYVSVQFRFLPVRMIPARQTTVPDTAEEQHNLARSEKVVERLEMDVAEGDKVFSNYGKLR